MISLPATPTKGFRQSRRPVAAGILSETFRNSLALARTAATLPVTLLGSKAVPGNSESAILVS